MKVETETSSGIQTFDLPLGVSPVYVTVKNTLKILGISLPDLKILIKNGLLTPYTIKKENLQVGKIPRKRLFKYDDIKALELPKQKDVI